MPKKKPAKKTTQKAPAKSITKPQEKSHESVKKPKIDWDLIEKEYCIGQKTTRAIGHQCGVSHVAIIRKAKKEGWVQDRTKEIRAKTNAGLASYQEGVTKKVTNLTKDDIEKAVQTNIRVITEHRKSIGFNQRLIETLSNQLKDAADNRCELAEGVDMECERPDGTKDGQKRARLLRALALPAHSAVLLSLTAAQKNLIVMERQALNIDKTEDPEDAIATLLKLVGQQSKPLVGADSE